MSADALDDNFELDAGLVADEVSGDEDLAQAGPSKRNRVIDEKEEDDFVSGSDVDDVAEGEDAEQSPPAKRTKIASKPNQQGQPALTAEEKKRKRKEKQKEAKVGHLF